MDLEEKFGKSPIKSKPLLVVVGILMTLIVFWEPITGLIESRAEGQKSVYSPESGKYVVSYKAPVPWPISIWKSSTWTKRALSSRPTLMTNQDDDLLVRIVDDAGAKEDLPCNNVVVESTEKPRAISTYGFYLRYAGLSVPVRWTKRYDAEHRLEFSDSYGNRGRWYCPEGVEKTPAK